MPALGLAELFITALLRALAIIVSALAAGAVLWVNRVPKPATRACPYCAETAQRRLTCGNS